MKRILHMTPPEVSNGVYRYIFNHMPVIDQEKYQFCFLTKNAEDLMATPEYRIYNFPVYKLNGVQRDGREAFEREIRSILSEDFDVIHLHTSSWRGFLIEEIAMDMGIEKVIVHSHSTGIDFEDEDERNKIYKDHVYYKELFDLKYATDLCACSKLAADWLFPNKIPRDIIKIMPNAIDAKKYAFNEAIRVRLRKKYGIENRTVLGHVGRYSYTKNQGFLIDCFCEAYKKNKSLFLILIGQGENIHKIKGYVKELDMVENILCLGWENNISDYLQAFDVFCLPSKFEGLPISVVEAQAAGLRCLVSDCVTSEVNITGDVVFLSLQRDVWRDAILKYSDEYIRLDTQKALIDAGYTIESSGERLCSLYDKVR